MCMHVHMRACVYVSMFSCISAGFKECDKKDLLEELGREILTAIETGEALSSPSLLNTVLLICHASIKEHK